MPSGDVLREIAVKTNDPANVVTVVPIRMRIQEGVDKDNIVVIPSKIAFGKIASELIVKRNDSFKVIVPNDGLDKKSKISIRSDNANVGLQLVDDSKSFVMGSEVPARVYTYRLKWNESPHSGILKAPIEIGVYLPGKPLVKIVVDVTGDIVTSTLKSLPK